MQNTKTLQQSIREHELNMPSEIINLIKSFDWKKEVRTIVNQNQLMIDVGGDLEESIYLVLLGVVTAEDLYKRLIESHEVPEDKAQKIIQEAESQIFSPMYKKLMELPSEDSVQNETTTPTTPRDAILAEIEKEPEIFVNLNVASIKSNKMSNIIETPSSQNVGIVKPFSMNLTPSVEEKEIIQEKKIEIDTLPPLFNMAAVTGVQEDPVASLLTQPTQVQAAAPTLGAKPYAADPYREPIE